mmetsp:Transcript_62352/g.165484  ORF Transcript_62352/g.165484 Transcript_62352/m.165484 type:complete len:344 (-) Transcript_62352:56-1087(-)
MATGGMSCRDLGGLCGGSCGSSGGGAPRPVHPWRLVRIPLNDNFGTAPRAFGAPCGEGFRKARPIAERLVAGTCNGPKAGKPGCTRGMNGILAGSSSRCGPSTTGPGPYPKGEVVPLSQPLSSAVEFSVVGSNVSTKELSSCPKLGGGCKPHGPRRGVLCGVLATSSSSLLVSTSAFSGSFLADCGPLLESESDGGGGESGPGICDGDMDGIGISFGPGPGSSGGGAPRPEHPWRLGRKPLKDSAGTEGRNGMAFPNVAGGGVSPTAGAGGNAMAGTKGSATTGTGSGAGSSTGPAAMDRARPESKLREVLPESLAPRPERKRSSSSREADALCPTRSLPFIA